MKKEDIEEIARQQAKSLGIVTEQGKAIYITGYLDGSEANKYSEEDLRKCFEAAQETIWEDLEQTVTTHKIDSFNEYLKTIKP